MISVKHAVALLLIVLCCGNTFSQSDSCNIKVSLLTCSPGSELYSIFGHTAIRVKSDPNFDIIYNYGTFDFEDPDFYEKFVKGKLDYYVSAETYEMFMREYRYENRGVIEQDLNMSCEERERLFEALRENSKEENKYYEYQYLFDNCSTRPRDIIIKGFDDTVNFKRILPDPRPTYRDMIHEYLDRGRQYWSAFGIDLLLASRIDRKVTNLEAMFLPDYLMKGLDSATVNGRQTVAAKRVLIRNIPALNQNDSWFTPLVFTSLLLVTGIIFTFLKSARIQKMANIFDIGYFLILGLMGCFMLFMWFGTDHELCRDNFNVIWALPTHAIMAVFMLKRNSFVRKYFAISAILSALLLISLPILPQEMNTAFLPLILLSAIRSATRSLKK
jgi:hypothetical protein